MTNSSSPYADEVFRSALPEILKSADLARALGVAERTARAWLQHRRVPGRKFAGRWLATRDEVLDAIRADGLTCADCCRALPPDAAPRRGGGLPVCLACADRLDARRERGDR